MAKVVTLRLDDKIYSKFKTYAEQDNRPISNYIETSTLRFIEQMAEYVDESEMDGIRKNKSLMGELKQASAQAKAGKGNFVMKL